MSFWADRKGIKINEAVQNSDRMKVRADPVMFKLPNNISVLEESIIDGEDSILERSL